MNKRPLRACLCAVILTALLTCPGLVLAAKRSINQWEVLVKAKLAAVAVLASMADAQLSHEPFIGSLHNQRYEDLTITLHKGKDYALIGVCDEDCRDLDLKLYDDEGDLVVKDTSRDATPTLEIVPRRTQDYTIRILMEDCGDSPCYFGLGVYSQ